MYKKIIFALALVGLCFVPHTAHAEGTETTVSGYVYDAKTRKPVVNALVYVACDSQGQYGDKRSLDNGYYSVTLKYSTCSEHSSLYVAAFKDGLTGNVRAVRTGKFTRVDVALGKTYPVPEYGWISVMATGIAGLGALMFVRRRMRAKHE